VSAPRISTVEVAGYFLSVTAGYKHPAFVHQGAWSAKVRGESRLNDAR
jgi:hypothetical protein